MVSSTAALKRRAARAHSSTSFLDLAPSESAWKFWVCVRDEAKRAQCLVSSKGSTAEEEEAKSDDVAKNDRGLEESEHEKEKLLISLFSARPRL